MEVDSGSWNLLSAPVLVVLHLSLGSSLALQGGLSRAGFPAPAQPWEGVGKWLFKIELCLCFVLQEIVLSM